MNVVDFAEGILGGRNQSGDVAKCLRQIAMNEHPEIQSRLVSVASDLESGKHIDIQRLRDIGEIPLSDAQRLFLDYAKEN